MRDQPFQRLSQYALFVGDAAAQEPAPEVISYDLNSSLFSDYAEKFRFIKLPAGKHATYRDDDVFEFPVGTVIAKTFAYPRDARDPSQGRRLIETRILKREPDGWVGLPYVWNDSQTEASLDVAGDTVDVSWLHTDGRPRTDNYIIPNANQCKGCHKIGETMRPIGPKGASSQPRLHLSGRNGEPTGPLEPPWGAGGGAGAARGPAPGGLGRPCKRHAGRPRRAWLEINCAHCHNPEGPARNSGLDLLASQQRPVAFGVYKPPVAAGLGSGGLAYDVVPGQPDQSILVYRISSTHPSVMMPELGKRLVHDEGVALVRQWIAAMPDSSRKHGAG